MGKTEEERSSRSPRKESQKTKNEVDDNENISIESITKIIDCSDSKLTIIPQSLSNCKCIIELRLSQNEITSIPDSILSLKSLKILKIDTNSITRLPKDWKELTNLEEIYLNHNKIKTLPSGISQLIKLKKLYLNNNRIKSIPEEISSLDRLDTLNLSHNLIEFLPNNLGKLKRLRKLIITHNSLLDFPMESPWKTLKILEVSYNSFPHTISISLKYFGEMRKIDVISNVNHSPATHRASMELSELQSTTNQDKLHQRRECTVTHTQTKQKSSDHSTDHSEIVNSPRKKHKLNLKRHKRGLSDTSDIHQLPSPTGSSSSAEKSSPRDIVPKLLKNRKKDNIPIPTSLYYPYPQSLQSNQLKFSEDNSIVISGNINQLLGLLVYDHSECKFFIFHSILNEIS